jgi:23S rRNA pseudouridine1911/1915/1917 synthase
MVLSMTFLALKSGAFMISGGTGDKPIGCDAKDRIKQAVNEDGKDAITHYRVIDRF